MNDTTVPYCVPGITQQIIPIDAIDNGTPIVNDKSHSNDNDQTSEMPNNNNEVIVEQIEQHTMLNDTAAESVGDITTGNIPTLESETVDSSD